MGETASSRGTQEESTLLFKSVTQIFLRGDRLITHTTLKIATAESSQAPRALGSASPDGEGRGFCQLLCELHFLPPALPPWEAGSRGAISQMVTETRKNEVTRLRLDSSLCGAGIEPGLSDFGAFNRHRAWLLRIV